MHPEYPNLEPRFALSWKESLNVPVQPFSPDWKFPMLDCQLFGDDLPRLNNDLRDIVMEMDAKFRNHTSPSQKAKKKQDGWDLTSTYEDWNFFYIDHPAVECLYYYFKEAHNAFIQKLDVNPGMPLNILCWPNAIRGGAMGAHSHQGAVEATYMSGNYCVNADRDTATIFKTPGFNDREIHVRNKPGQLTLFPQWVNHWTTQHDYEEGDDPRITIAADIDVGHYAQYIYDQETGERVHYIPFNKPPHEKARREGVDVGDLGGVDGNVVKFVNTPLETLEEEDLHFDFDGYRG